MKLSRLLLLPLFLSICLIPIANGQSWEVFFENPNLTQSYYNFVFPTANNEVRLTESDLYNNVTDPIFSFDQEGNYIGQSTIGWTADWGMVNTDKTGASYWITFYKLRKLNANNQIAWTYSPPVSAGILWNQAAPNGGTCLQYSANNNSDVIDYVNANGQLVKRFEFAGGWPDEYFPGHDNSLIYTDDIFGSPQTHWTKLDQNGQVVWEIDLDENIDFLAGSLPDGSTYYHEGDILTKLDATGNVEWQRNIEDYVPGTSSTYLLGMLVREDESIVLAVEAYGTGSSETYSYFVNLDPANGYPIWSKRTANSTGFSAYLTAPLAEMPDGGILACFEVFGNSGNDQVLIVRTDPNGNTLTNQIAGKIYWDENTDCAADPDEKALKQFSVIAQSGTKKYSATSDSDGNFEMATSGGEYTLSIAQAGSYWSYCDFPNSLQIDPGSDTVLLSIGAKAEVICPELSVSIGSPVFRRCFDNNYLTVQYQNFGTAPAEDAYVTITLDPKLLYLSATAPLLSQNGQAYTFDIGTVEIGESGFFTINFKVDCDATLGEILCVDSQIYPDTLCIPTARNKSSNQFCQPVVASYDPNDKTAFVGGKPETAKILPDLGLEYLIRFQNTGNDTAFNIVIADTLNSRLDPTSVIPGASSHPYFFELRDGKVLRFVFNHILLPDSTTNEAASHGFVKFLVRQTPGNPIGATISNTAAIYFDYNAPVITNESKLVVSNPVRVKETTRVLEATTWPVPAHDQVEVLLPTKSPAILAWKLIDLNGRVQRTGGTEASQFFIRRNGLPSGVYWCQLLLENGSTALGRIVFE